MHSRSSRADSNEAPIRQLLVDGLVVACFAPERVEVDWKPKVTMTMSSEVANRYFQGKENVAMAVARRRIKTGGDVKAALALIPITKPVYAQYRDYLEREKPHLLV